MTDHKRSSLSCLLALTLAFAQAQVTTAPARVTFTDPGRPAREYSIRLGTDRDIATGIEVLGAGGDGGTAAVPARDIRRLELDGGVTYVRFLRRFSRTDASGVGVRDSAYRLARLLVDGPAALYRLDVPRGEKRTPTPGKGAETYFLTVGEAVFELSQTYTPTADGRLRRSDRYVRILQRLAADACPRLRDRLERRDLAYAERALTEAVVEYNTCLGGESTLAETAPSGIRLSGVWVEGGVADVFVRGLAGAPTLAPSLGAYVTLRALRKPRLRFGIGVEGYRGSRGDLLEVTDERTCFEITSTRVACEGNDERFVPGEEYGPAGFRVPAHVAYTLTSPLAPAQLFAFGGASAGLDESYRIESKFVIASRIGLGARFGWGRVRASFDSDRLLRFALGVRVAGE